jgi:uncharacterized protein (UPF0147 family)
MNIDSLGGIQNNRLPLLNENIAKPDSEQALEAAGDTVAIGQKACEPEKKELTMLFYMHGQYKDLHRPTAGTFFQLEAAGSNENVNVVAQLGRAVQDEPGKEPQNVDGDWSGVRRYKVEKHDHSDMNMTFEQWVDVEKKLPNNPLVHYSIGDIYWGQGDKEKALAEYQKAKDFGMLSYMENTDSPESKKVREEYEAATKAFEEPLKDKAVYGSKPVEVLPEGTKMGDPESLKDFVAWGMKNYPAEHYIVVVTGHGGAWIGALEMSPTAMDKAIKGGVEKASQETGEQKKLDALIFNSCYMGNMESAYEMKGTADINISSENYSRGNMLYDWDEHINTIQGKIKEQGQFDPKAFAKDFVEYYRKEGKEIKENFPEFINWKESYLTLTAVDNKKMDGVVGEWKNFIDSCKANKVPDNVIFKEFSESQGFNSSAFNPAQTIFAFYDMIKDLGDIMKHVVENPAIPQAVKDQAEKVQSAIKDAVIAEQHEGNKMDNSTGLTVWAPSNAVDIAYMANRYEKENVPEFVKAAPNYPAYLKEGAKKVDQKILKEFMNDTQVIRNIKTILDDPASGLSETEKKVLEEAKVSITGHAMKLKEKLDMTVPQVQSLWARSLRQEPDFALYGEMARDTADEAAKKGGLGER